MKYKNAIIISASEVIIMLIIMGYGKIALSSISVYLFIIIAIRIFGKKELAQLSVVDLVFILLISNSVQNAMVGSDSSLLGGIISAGTLFLFNHVFKLISYKYPKFNKLVEGEATMLVYNGIVNKKNMEKAKISMSELLEAMREHGISSISEINLAVLEVDGNISILSNEFKQKTTKKRKPHKIISKTEG